MSNHRFTLPTLRRAKKALGVRSLKREEGWDWQLLPLATIPLPTPFLSLTSHDPLEHLQEKQIDSVSDSLPVSIPAVPDPVESLASDPEERASDPAPEDETPQPPENMEDVQETPHVVATNGQAKHAPAPRYCPGCGRPTTWVERGGILFCYKCHTPALRKR